MISEEFANRVNDINSYFNVLGFIDGIEAYKKGHHISNVLSGEKLRVNSDMQKCMRANAVVLLYNFVESTFRNCVYLVYDAIHDEELKYDELSDDMKRVWIQQQFKSDMKVDKVRIIVKTISDEINNTKVRLVDMPKGSSGNLNLGKVIELSKMVGINLGRIPDKTDVERTLDFLKIKRNDLAHGNCTFSSVGSMVTYQDLVAHKNHTIRFLNHLIRCFRTFVDEKKYKKGTMES